MYSQLVQKSPCRQGCFELTEIHLLLLPECWDQKYMSPHPAASLSDKEFLRYGGGHRAFGMFPKVIMLRTHPCYFASSLNHSVGSWPGEFSPCFIPVLQIPLDTCQTCETQCLLSGSQSQDANLKTLFKSPSCFCLISRRIL